MDGAAGDCDMPGNNDLRQEIMARHRDRGDPKYQIYKKHMEMFLQKGSTGELLAGSRAGEARRRETGLRYIK